MLMLLMAQTTEGTGKEDREALDRLLIEIAAGSREALAELYHRTRTAVYGITLSYVKNAHDAQDLTQDAFVRIWEKAPQYRPQGSPMAWILAVARNLALMALRQRERQADLSEEEWDAIPAEGPALSPEERELLQTALAALEEDTLLLEAAEEAGYTAQEEVQAACDARLEELRQYCVDTGLKSLGDYFTSYYDTGMTQDLYLELYSGQILAESYRKALEEELGPSEADVEDYVAALGTAADYTADLSLASFEAEADRVSGQPEQRQWDNARTLGETFLDRWAQEGGGTERFCAMAVAYTRAEEVPQDGVWTDMAADDLEDEVAQWCFQGQPAVGETALLQGEKGWWAVCYLGQGEDARAIQARQDLWQARYDQWRAQRQADRTTATHALGMAIAL